MTTRRSLCMAAPSLAATLASWRAGTVAAAHPAAPTSIDTTGDGPGRNAQESTMPTTARETTVPHATGMPIPRAVRTPAPAPETRPPHGDYELTITIEFDFQDYSGRATGDPIRMTYGQYQVVAGRENGAWRMGVMRVLAEDAESGEDIYAPMDFAVHDQTDGPDPLALLQALLGGQAVLDGTRFVRDLTRTELAALRLAPPDLRAELLVLMQRNGLGNEDAFATWFGRYALTASSRELDRFFHPDPAYMALAARVKSARLRAKVLAERASQMAASARELAAWAEQSD